MSSGKEWQYNKILSIDFDIRREFSPQNGIFQLYIILNRVKGLNHKPINMQHHKPLIRNFIHVLGRIRYVKVDKFFLVKIYSDGVDQLDDEILDGCIFLFILLSLEERIFEEKVVRSLNYQSVNILLVYKCCDERHCPLKPALDCTDCLDQWSFATADWDSRQDLDRKILLPQ